METTKVKCQDCGLLALKAFDPQHTVAGNWLVSPNLYYRDNCIIAEENERARCSYEPVCMAAKYNYIDEFRSCMFSDSGKGIALPIVQNERHCDGFVKWRFGFSPKEQMKMKYEEDAKLESQKWQKDIEDNRMEFNRSLHSQTQESSNESQKRQQAHEERLAKMQVEAQIAAARLTGEITWNIGILAAIIAFFSMVGSVAPLFFKH